jgi:hypothetical protein
LNDSSTTYYQKGPTQTIESYRMYSQPSTTVTQVTEETRQYQIPSQQQHQHSEITYSIHGTQPKYQPVSFIVSSNQETTQPTITTDEDDQSMITHPYQQFNTQYRTRSNQNIIPSYGNDTTTTTTTTATRYSQQPRNTSLLATVAKQAGPSTTYYQQESDSMQTESETVPFHNLRSTQQSTSSYISSQPNFTKVDL